MVRPAPIASSSSTSHGPGHRGCPSCDPDGASSSVASPSAARRPISVARVQARGEEFTVVQVVGNLFVCSRANGSCCCGWEEKERMPFDNALWSDEWERRRLRNRVHLTFVGCLGPCAVGNNALLQVHGRSVWFKDLNDARLAARVFDYIEASLAAGRLVPVPDELRGHLYERYLAPVDAQPWMAFDVAGDAAPVGGDAHAGGAGEVRGDDIAQPLADERDPFPNLDPVCLMDVDPATARFTIEHDGRTFAFCGPGCRREFLEDPAAFTAAGPG